ncbi:MAG: tRNA (adenosine(37)-N6)-threonylcarbamoyltransferase complex ATPase subunit type 1 TsaE, partial [Patescibacteria group bacterium]
MKAFDKKYATNSAQETQKIGQNLAKKLKPGDFLALFGELGGGKTTFVQGLVKGLGIKRRIISPTFIILRQYKISPPRSPFGHLGGGKTNFYHIDLYRINMEKYETSELGLDEIIRERKDIIAVEWAEKMGDLLPKNRWEIN